MALRLLTNRSKNLNIKFAQLISLKIGQAKYLSHYPVDDSIFGLNEDQQQVKSEKTWEKQVN